MEYCEFLQWRQMVLKKTHQHKLLHGEIQQQNSLLIRQMIERGYEDIGHLYFSGFCEVSRFRAITAIHANCWGTIGAKVADLTAVVHDWKRFRSLSIPRQSLMPLIGFLPATPKCHCVHWRGESTIRKSQFRGINHFVISYGSSTNMPTLTFASTSQKYGTVNSATVIVEADYFVATNLIIKNSSPRPYGKRVGVQTVALRVSGNKSALYNCRLIGFQDTLCDDMGNHFFKYCYIEGTVDFIFGSGKSLYLMPPKLSLLFLKFSLINTNSKEDELESAYIRLPWELTRL
ncbi:Pectin lyase-like superfamily protein [Prunus dulcis]|uniref:Pectinesterase n=1 Tax=Prunus dulcis TaxID=3755 RepID=A0A4Y1R635_PRUDU|nr:Pectin lyase-like superfamily protein [Prunus dulcis]